MKKIPTLLVLEMVLLAAPFTAWAQSGSYLTVQIGAPPTPPVTLVNHSDNWRYRRGTNEPPANWKTASDALLDSTWLTGPGGFGYGDPGIVGENTTISGMTSVHTTLYIRKTFTVGNLADTNAHLRLKVDYDDGFAAYLDGVEVARRNLTNAAGAFVPYNATIGNSHEASCCDSPNPAETIDLGAVGGRLPAGEHVLAIIGVNSTIGSSDFHLIADLTLDGGASSVINGAYLSLVTTNLITLLGSNTVAGSARVTVNGDEATFNPAQGAWSKSQTLNPGMNRLFIAALDASGAILAATNLDIVCQVNRVEVGGPLAGNAAWTDNMGIIHVTNDLTVGAGFTLSIGSNVVVLLSPNASILAQTGGVVSVDGTEHAPVYFLPADGSTLWGELCADGTNASVMLRHAETVAGRLRVLNGGTLLVEDSVVRDFPSATREIVAGVSGGGLTLRRAHLARYSEIDSQDTPFLAEDCLIEYPNADGLDIKSTSAGVPLVVRRTTLRFGSGGNTDALDLGPGPNVTIERCLVRDWPDKGVSVGAGAADVIVRGCLFYNVGKGVEVADSATAVLVNTTVSASSNGFHLFEKTAGQGGGHATATNNILWGNSNAFSLANGSTLEISHSDIEGGYAGEGNLDTDPLFLDPAAKDFRLATNSPARGAGLGGADMGAIFPVGGIPAPPMKLAALTDGPAGLRLTWLDASDNEESFLIQRSTNGLSWQELGSAPANSGSHSDFTALANQKYYYRVRAENSSGVSRWSNPAAATAAASAFVAWGMLASNTVWSPARSPVLVVGDVTVPTNVTLTIEAGTVVRLTNNAMLVASTGGVIRILGTWDNRVVLERWNGTNNWGEIRAIGTNSFLDIHFADISGGQTTVYYDATALIEDSYFHHHWPQGPETLYNRPLILTHYAGPCFVRRCFLSNYYETLWRHGINVIEDTVFEYTVGDALDFDTGQPGSVIRRCTFRHGTLGNVDAIDMGNDGAYGTEGAIVEDCHMYNFPFDKGVSIGENSFNITVRNCLIHDVVRGVQVKDVSTANIYNCTIVNAMIGIHGYEKTAGTGAGRVTNSHNNILWGLSNAIAYDPVKSVMVVDYTDTGGTNWPSGTGNINADPLFVNPAAGDWRLQSNSPCLGTGKDGANMGVTFPVGVFITAPSELTASAAGSNAVLLAWRDNSPSEAVFLIERATDGGPFVNIGYAPRDATNYLDTAAPAGHAYGYRVQGANITTNSLYSGEAWIGAGAGIYSDTTWYATNGIYVVTNNLRVAGNATLTIEPGVTVQVRQGCGFTVNGRLLAEGTVNQPIKFTRYPGDATWERIMFVDAADSRLRHCLIEFCNSVGDHQDYYPTNCGPPPVFAPRNYHEAVVVLASHVDFDYCSFTNLPSTSATAEGDAIAVISDDAQHPGPASANIRHCNFIRIGQGVHTRYAQVLVEYCVFQDKHGDNDDVDLYGESSPPCIIRYNQFLYPSYDDRINPTRCSALIYGNTIYGSTDHGIVLRDVSRPILFNNVLYNCSAGGITIQNGCDALLVNNTIVNCNRAIKLFDHTGRLGPPYCLAAASGKATVLNCIIWNSTPAFDLSGASGGPIQEFYLHVANSLVQGGTNNATLAANARIVGGEGVINVDPRFADLTGTNFHLLPDSPCIDAGAQQTYLGSNLADFITLDFDQLPRPRDGNADGTNRYDIGAFEFQPPVPQPKLQMTAPAGYLPGLPVLVRVEILDTNGAVDRSIWDAEATLTTDRPEVVLSTNRALLKNGLGSALVTFTGGSNFNLTATAGNLVISRPMTSLAGAPVNFAGGMLPAGTNIWSGVVRVTNDVTVPAEATLQIQPGTWVLMDGVASGAIAPDLLISGVIQSLGTAEQPVTITCSDPALRWGQIRHNTAQPSLYRYTSITRGGRAPGEGHTGAAPVVRPSNSTLVFESCNFTDLAEMDRGAAGYGTPGKVMYGIGSDLTLRDCLLSRARMGPEIQGTAVLMTNCWMIDMRGNDDADGFYIHAQQAGQTCAFKHCVAAGGDDDGFDTLDSIVQIEDTILRDWNNLLEDAKAVSVFNGETHIRRCLIVDSTVGVAAKNNVSTPTFVTINQSTITANETNVMAAWKANAPGPFIDFRITNCVLWGNNSAHSDFGDTNLTIVYSDLSEPWAGQGNIQADPLFVDAASHDYRLRPGSPCINSGDPASPTDPDGSRADMGYFPVWAEWTPSLQVAITAPAQGTILFGPIDLTLEATATSTTGSIAQVEFFADGNSLGVAANSPYSIVWSNVPLGAFTLTAVATENSGLSATSAPINITVVTNVAPVVSLTYPADGASFPTPGPVILAASATDADGNLVKVEFYQGSTKLGEAASSPYNFAWNDIAAGAYILTAVAVDSAGLRATSAPVNVTIQAVMPPWGALDFNGSNQYVALGQAPGLGASNFTLEAWVKWTGRGVTANSGTGGANVVPVITKGRGEGDNSNVDCNYFFGIQANGLLAADFEEYPTVGAGGTNRPIVGVTPVPSNEWHHIAATYDGVSWRLYLDGQLDNERVVGTLPRWDSRQHAALGSALNSSAAPAGYFSGLLDEARIWNYARSAAQISNSMTVPIPAAPGLLGRWSLDETNGVFSYDTSGNHHYGTNMNNPARAWGYPFAAPPLVAITSPADGSLLYTPGDFSLSATATALVGVITKVVFWAGTNELAEITDSPYTWIWRNPPEGHYDLFAVATDLAGQQATSAPVQVTVIQAIPPLVDLVSPAGDLLVDALSSLTLTATAADSDGTITNLAFYADANLLGQLTGEPYSLAWSNIVEGTYAVFAVATDNDGLSATSRVARVTASSATNPPVVTAVSPAPGNLENLTQITVTFSKAVQGVDAADLLINGVPAGGISGSGSNYAFQFVEPAFGEVTITWAENHGITDLFTPARAFDTNSPGAIWQYHLGDFTPPTVAALTPAAGAVLPALSSVSVSFSEAVTGVSAGDLLINGNPAGEVSGAGAGPYVFGFAPPVNGLVQMGWAAGHGIRDAAGNEFAGGGWTYTLNTNLAGIVISEIMYHPSSENDAEEFIELFNSGPAGVNLAGWRFTQGIRFTFADVVIPPQGYLVVAADAQAFTNRYPDVTNVIGGWEGLLSNNRNVLRLEDAAGRKVDEVNYASEGDWAVRQRTAPDRGYQGWHWLKEHDGYGKSLELINPAMPNEYGQNWAASLVTNGTPGQPNSVASANLPPMILDARHLPVIPSETDPVLVTARILDEQPANVAVTLYWRVDAAAPAPFASTNMHDDGTHGDAVAGDGLFAATLPPQAQATIVEFYLRAEDQDGLVRTWPAAAVDTNGASLGQACNLLYQVDTNLYAGDQPLYRLIMTENERAALNAIQYNTPAGAAQSDASMNGAFISVDATGTECRYLVSIRNRGHGTRTAHPNNFRVNFNADRPWKGVGAINLNGQYTWCQIFGAALAQRSGLAGADSRAVQVRVNSTNQAALINPDRTYGSYAANEVLNSDWAENHFPNDSSGNIYRVIRDNTVPSANFEYRGDNKEVYTNCFFKQSNVSRDDWSDLAAMLRVMGTNDLFTTANARQVANVEQWLLHLAVMTLLGNNETGLNSGYNDDYFMYRGVNDPRFLLVFYDLDTIVSRGLATNASIWGATTLRLSPPQDSGTAMAQLLHWPDFEPLYYRTLQRLIDTTFSAPQFNSLLNQVLGGFVPGSTLQAMTNWMNGRRAYVQSVIAPYVTPPANPPVATLTGVPRAITPLASATLTVGGSNVVAYRFRLNDGDYSGEFPVNTPIELADLPHGGANVVQVIGRDSTGAWQDAGSPTVSRAWVVLTNWPAVRLNEILARNDSAVNWHGQYPDLIELFNEGASPADLSGMRLTDDPANPGKFTFPEGTTLAPGDYLVVVAGNADGAPGLHTGFALSQDGEGVYLLDRAASGNTVLDSVVFGLQIANYSLGRLGGEADWRLTQPTLGAPNIAQPLGHHGALRLNEWLAFGQAPFADDFIELYNPASLPVALEGLCLTDQPFGAPARHRLAPLSFIPALGHLVLVADGSPAQGSNHLSFRLAAEQGLIGLMDPDLTPIDQVWYGPQTLNQSAGRCPDGAEKITALRWPTPGAANACPVEPSAPVLIPLLASTNLWRYDQSGADLGTAWRGTNYDDSGWPEGPGVLGYSPTATPEPIRTPLSVGTSKTSFYFRTSFLVPPGVNLSGLQATCLLDDGAVFYLNGEEAYRYNMPAGAILATTLAAASVDATAYVGPFSLPVTNLRAGVNLLAVEVHQIRNNSSDIVFGCALDLLVLTNTPAAAGLVINEVLANNNSLREADGRSPDWVEIFNPSDTGVDLRDMSLSDSAANPRRWIFPPGATIGPQGYFLVRLDAGLPASATNAGFGFNADGDAVYLFDKPANGGGVIDFIAFGWQIPDFSLGRLPGAATNWGLNYPTLGATNLAAVLGDPTQLKINEWMASPAAGDDWFEIYNPQALPAALGGLWLTDDFTAWDKSPIPALSFIGVFSNAYRRVWADNQSGGAHANFALKATGEQIALYTPGGALIDGVAFGAQQTGLSEGRLPDGAAARAVFAEPSPASPNFLPLAGIVISEVLAHSDPPFEDAIELQNLTEEAVDISGWWLSDANDQPQKYQLPPGTVLPAGGFAVFYEYQFNDRDLAAVPFALSSANGDAVYLSAAAAGGALTGYRASVKFGPSLNGVSFGRHVTSTGEADFAPMSARSFGVDDPADLADFRRGAGLTNPCPLVGPVVISEIMYHPPDLDTNDNVIEEFVELRNISAETVFLYDTNHPANTWRLGNAVEFDLPSGLSLAPGAALVVVGFDPVTNLAALAQFQARYGSNAVLAGPYAGKLDNSDEPVELRRPDAPQTLPGPDFGLVPYALADRVHYRDRDPWPAAADGHGYSLQRTSLASYGNDPTNWVAAAPTPGSPYVPPPLNHPPQLAALSNQNVTLGQTLTFTVSATDTDLPPQSLVFSLDPGAPDGASLDPANGLFRWTPATNQPPGNYAATVRVTDDGTPPLEDSATVTITVWPLPQASVLSPGVGGTQMRIAFGTVPGKTYRIEFKNRLEDPWAPLVDDILGTGSAVVFPDEMGGRPQRFYRIVQID